jgi:hypothetical protein
MVGGNLQISPLPLGEEGYADLLIESLPYGLQTLCLA